MSEKGKEVLQSRRHFLSSLLEAGLSIPKSWAQERMDAVQGVPGEARRKTAVSPPGSVSHEHLNSSCNACGICIAECPSKVLRPSTDEYSLSAMAQPVLDFSRGWCDYDCTICGDKCPNGAILPLSQEAKQDVQIGVAVLVKGLCINADDNGLCSICADDCPASAIKMKEDYNSPIITGSNGEKRYRVYPEIEDALCIGCGRCEYLCPSSRAKAIHIEGLSEHID